MADDITPEAPEAFDPAALDDAALAAEFARIKERGAELAAKAEFAAGEVDELADLADRATAVQAEATARAERATQVQAHRDAFASLGDLPVIPEAVPIAAPAAVEAPVSASETVQAPPVPSVSAMAVQAPAAPVETRRRDRTRIAFSTDGAGVLRKGTGEDATVRELGEASSRLFAQFGSSRVGGGVRAERAVGQFTREREFAVTGNREQDAEMLTAIRNKHGGEAFLNAAGDGVWA